MRARLVLWIGVGLGLSGCLLPTPVSIVTSGFDAVSFVASGKTVTDHGVSLVMGEDCALVRVLEGEVCREERGFEVAASSELLAPLPRDGDPLLAEAHPEVRAAAVRVAAHDGWPAEPLAAPQYALLAGGFVADEVAPSGHRPMVAPIATQSVDVAALPAPRAEPVAETAVGSLVAAAPIPKRRPLAQGELLAQAAFVGSGWPAARAAPAASQGLLAERRSEPLFASVSDEFGERLTSVRYGDITKIGEAAPRRVAQRRWGTEFDG